MNLEDLKAKIDTKAAYDKYKTKYEYKRKEMKRAEVKKIFDGFKEFFKADSNFKFKQNEHSIAAEYKEHAIKLEMDIYNNIDSDDFRLTGTIKTYEKDTFEFIAEGICSIDPALPPSDSSPLDRMVHDTRYYKDFLDGNIDYTFTYNITGREGTLATMQQLMEAL
ncbi:hypothetical protein GR160_01665 [Flavobacterium sp. Sd200]|uniref:hypothetical protein n=1 Tax=Flavobacterium sp. Sd200 TaxID=2692211 RepID=UPI00136BBC50|nr:hypothetical protein [Flavobacterium sp. Sd200]MXN89921.1 hypothetical protein [Flavobacterium sp. Sd200]